MNQPTNINQLKLLLNTYNINYANWGKNGQTKSINNLFKELQTGDSILNVEEGNLIRKSTSLWIDVFRNETLSHVLHEKKQFLLNGKVKLRNENHPVTEKQMRNEGIMDTLQRGLNEELGLTRSMYKIKQNTHTQINKTNSKSYPGLKAVYKKHFKKIILLPNKMPEMFKQNNFITQNSNGKKILWKWDIVRTKRKANRPKISEIVTKKENYEKVKKRLIKEYNYIHPNLKMLNNEKPKLIIILGPMGSGKSSIEHQTRFGLSFKNYIINNVVESLNVFKDEISTLLKNIKNIKSINVWKTEISNLLRNKSSKIYSDIRKQTGVSKFKETYIINSILKRENIMIESTGNYTSNIYTFFEKKDTQNLLFNNNYDVYFFNVYADKDVSFSRGITREFKQYRSGSVPRLTPKYTKYNKAYDDVLLTINAKMKEYISNSKYNELIKQIFFINTTDFENIITKKMSKKGNLINLHQTNN